MLIVPLALRLSVVLLISVIKGKAGKVGLGLRKSYRKDENTISCSISTNLFLVFPTFQLSFVRVRV